MDRSGHLDSSTATISRSARGDVPSADALVGRTSELAEIVELLQRTRSGRAGSLLVVGEAGAGKSALLRQVVRVAHRSRFRVLAVEGDHLDADVPYAALHLAVAGLLAGERDPGATEALTALAALLPAAGRRTAEVPQQTAAAVRAALGHLVDVWTVRGPALVAVDDLHAVDGATRDTLLSLIEHVGERRLLIVATARAQPDVDPGLGDTYRRLGGPGRLRVLRLGELDAADVAELAHRHLGRGLDPTAVRSVSELSGGMPFFAIELLAAIEDSPASGRRGAGPQPCAAGGRRVPTRLRAAVLHRLTRLGPDARSVAAAVAVVGDVDARRIPVLVGLTRLPLPRVDAALGTLVERGYLGLERGRYRFRQHVVRATLYADLGPARLRRWHDEIARALHATSDGSHESLIEIGEHLRRTSGGPDPNAAAVLVRVGDILAESSPGAAAAWYREALARLRPDDPVVPETQLRLIAVLVLDGDHAQAALLAGRTLRTAAPGALRTQATAAAARAWAAQGGHDIATEMLDAVIADGDAAAAELLLQRAHLHLAAGRLRAAEDDLAAARARGVSPHEWLADSVAMHLDAAAGRFRDAERRATDLQRQLGGHPPGAAATIRLSLALCAASDLDPRFAAGLVASVTPDGPMAAWFHGVAAYARLRQGRFGEALALAERAWALAGPVDLLLHTYAVPTIAGAIEVGDLGAAETASIGAARDAVLPGQGLVDVARARLLTARGELDAAASLLGASERRETSIGRVGVLGAVLAQRVDTALAAGDADAARAANERLQGLANDGAGVALTMHQQLAAALTGDDLAAAERARAHAVEFDLAVDGARALAVLGARRRDPTVLLTAYEELADLGSTYSLREVANELRRLGRRVPSRRATDELTSVERHVAMLVAQGLTNREVAQQTNLSPKTVEVYLSRIYGKTGCRSRVELAVAVNEGRFDPTRGAGAI